MSESRVQKSHPSQLIRLTQRARSGDFFVEIRAKFALVPNLFRVLANAPVALEGLMSLSTVLAGGALDEQTRATRTGDCREQPVRLLLGSAQGCCG